MHGGQAQFATFSPASRNRAMRVQGRQAQILWFWATSKMLTPRSRPWRTSLARPHKQSHDIGGLMDRSSRELGRHQKRSVSMLWSRAKWALLVHPRQNISCHGFFIAAMVIIALLLSSRTFLLALLSPFIARVVTPAFGAFGYCGRPSCTSVLCSDSAGTADTYCDSSASRRKRDAVLLQGRRTRFQMAEVCLASMRTSQILPGQ